MGCDSQAGQMAGCRISVKRLAWIVVWCLSLSWIQGAGAGTIAPNIDEKPFSHDTVVEMAKGAANHS
jgi:hypothetical protein